MLTNLKVYREKIKILGMSSEKAHNQFKSQVGSQFGLSSRKHVFIKGRRTCIYVMQILF